MEQQLTTPNSSVHRVSIKLPNFWCDKPNIWFSQADSQFFIANITNEVTKYHHVVSQLDARAAAEVEDIILSPPTENPYTFLRTKLVERLSVSEEQRVRQLLTGEELGDRKPSQFLRYLKSLSGTTSVQPNLLKQLWLQRLPSNAQAILTAQPNLSIEQLSELADKIVEVSPVPIPLAVHATSDEQVKHDNSILNALDDLNKQIAELRSNYNHNSSHSQSRGRYPPRQQSKDRNDFAGQICWYHATYKNKARKCISPCKFQVNYNDSQ